MSVSSSVCFILTQPNHYGFYQEMIDRVALDFERVVIIASEKVISLLVLKNLNKIRIFRLNNRYVSRSLGLRKLIKNSTILITEEPYVKIEFLSIIFSIIFSRCKVYVIVHNANTWFSPSLESIRAHASEWVFRKIIRAHAYGFIVVSQSIKKYLENVNLCSRPVVAFPFCGSRVHSCFYSARRNSGVRLTVAVPGVVDTTKKNYDIVLEAFKILWEEDLPIELLLLGVFDKKNIEIARMMNNFEDKERGLFRIWEDFISQETYEKELKRSDIILSNTRGCLKKKDGTIEFFGITKETGAVSLMEQYGVPGILPFDYVIPLHLSDSVLQYYNAVHLAHLLRGFIEYPDSFKKLRINAKVNAGKVDKIKSGFVPALRIKLDE